MKLGAERVGAEEVLEDNEMFWRLEGRGRFG